MLGCIWFGGWPFHLLIVLVGFGLAFEWTQLWRGNLSGTLAAMMAGTIVAAVLLAALSDYRMALGVVVIGSAALAVLCRGRPWIAAGIPYLALGAMAVLWIRDDIEVGRSNLVFMLLLIWASDIGAYLAGRLIGGAKMAPLISPGKTWSGAAGGLLAAVLVAWTTALLLHPPVSLGRVIILALVLGIVAQAGDLLESWMKRRFGVKDSGWLIPGHGGLLDRVDAVLTVAPVAAALALFAGRGVVLWQ